MFAFFVYNVYMKFFKKDILKYGTIILIFLAPLVYFGSMVFPHIASKTFFFYGFANILFFYWIYIIIVDKSYRLSKKQILFLSPLFAYIIWMTLAGLFAVNSHLAFWSTLGRGTGLMTLYYATALLLIIISLVRHFGQAYLIAIVRWFLYSSFIVALTVWFGNEGFHIQSGLFINSGGGGIIGNSSLAAAYFMFSLFFGVFLLFSKSLSKIRKIFISIIMAVILFSPLFINLYRLFKKGDILGSARGAILGIIVGVGVYLVSYFVFSKNKIMKILGIIGVVTMVVVFSVGWVKFMNPNTNIHKKFTEVATGTRFLFWDVAKVSMNKHPLLGYGPENYMIAFQENFNPKILNKELSVESWNDRAHNIYFDTGVSGGYPAILFYAVFLLSIFYGVFVLFKEGKISLMQLCSIYGLLSAYIFQNLFVFDSTLSILSLLILAGLIYGSIDYINKDKKENKLEKQNGVLEDKTAKVIIGSSVFIIFITVFVYTSVLPARKAFALGHVFGSPISTRSSMYNGLLSGSNVGNDWDVSGFAHDIYKFYASNSQALKNDKSIIPIYEKDINSLIKYLEEIEKTNKTDFRLYMKIFNLYSTSIFIGDKSLDQNTGEYLLGVLDKAINLSPHNPEVYWGMAQLYAWSGNIKGIEESYKKAIAIDPQVSASHKLLIQFAQAIRDEKLYNEAIIQAEKDIPGFVEANKKELNIIQNNI